MVSRSVTKFIKSLQLKKYRKQEQLFLVEGEKSVLEVMQSAFEVQQIFATSEFQQKHNTILRPFEVFNATEAELSSMGSFKSNNSAIAVVNMRPNTSVSLEDDYALMLDGINDPGNLGTIVRIADWYGIKKIVASTSTAELYNPKVISASKGSFTRVQFYYTSLTDYLREVSGPVYGAFMEGDDVHGIRFTDSGVIVLGNESNGISFEVSQLVTHRISIPRYGHAESLNVGAATAVICDNLVRTTLPGKK